MKKFKFYIQSFNGASLEYLYVNSAGVVTFTATKTEIQFAPEGWAENGIELERGFTYYGLFTSYSKPLTFLRDGAQIIRWLFYNNYQSKTATLVVEMYNPNVIVTDYQTYYTGDIDLTTFKDNTTNDGCSCNIVQGGNNQLLKSKANIVYDVDITGMATKVKLEGIVQDGISRHACAENMQLISLGVGSPPAPKTLPFNSVYYDFAGYNNGDVNSYNSDATTRYQLTNINTSKTISCQSKLNGSYIIVNSDVNPFTLTVRIQIEVFDLSTLTTVTSNVLYSAVHTATAGTITGPIAFNFDITTTGIVVPANHGVRMSLYADRVGFLTTGPNNLQVTFGPNSLFDFTIKTKAPATYCWAVRPLTLFKELIKKMTGSTVNGNSNLLQNDAFAKTILVTTGDMIRGVNNMIIKTSFNSFFKSFNSILNCGVFMAVNNTIRLERKSSIFLNSGSATIGCSKLKISPLTEQMFSSVKIGYPNKFNNDVNGKYEFNKERTLSVTNPRATQSLDLTSDYRADIYGIEEIRNTYTAIPFADTESNEDVFLVQILDTPFTDPIEGTYYKPFTAAGGILANTSDPTNCYNFLISPMQNIRRHDNYLTSIFLEKLLVNESSSKTATSELTYTVGTVFIDEAADYTLVATPLFKPYVFELDSAEQEFFYSTLLASSFSRLNFTYKGNSYNGYLIKGKSIPSHLQKQEFRLLCGPSVNLNNLIN